MLFTLKLLSSEEKTDLVTGLLAYNYPQGFEEKLLTNGETLFQLFSANKEELVRLKEEILAFVPEIQTSLEEMPEQDWLHDWKIHFKPVLCGEKFVVLPPWETLNSKNFAPRIPLIIEPKNAFGTGQHETTNLCLTIFSELLEAKKLTPELPFLDLGTGSGILALAALKVGFKGIGLDLDSDALANAKDNAKLNALGAGLELKLGSIEKVKGQRFGLIFANILASPLIAMAKDLTAALEPGGTLILSGLLKIQAKAVSLAYEQEGLSQAQRRDLGEWSALYFRG
ncbi:MAG: 50S ribosomal protein L11 methyltransferase [Desulfovibrionaceae bacterium]|nr:50S ribosomal protein L11 methyltransferase [Desulfovibrionaceae bacterium]